ncbi:MAG: exopolyphosphatase [Bacteroidetes bacterium]|nr:exopolyphosphatase [Bacteroidota bacterium]MDA1122090.1 exopolyphosphatase [Bacteroidota bacterium]
MTIAIIDMGTNTFHLLVSSVREGTFTSIYQERITVRIGANGISDGIINEEAATRAINALKLFRLKIDEIGVDQIFATASSAIRCAENGMELVQRIKDETGIKTRIITGDEEAESIYYGVKKALDLGDEISLIMDVGGGSIEFILGNSHEIFWKGSYEMGGQRLLDQFHKNDPMKSDEIQKLNNYINETLQPLFEASKHFNPQTLIGSSGTFDSLSDIFRLRNNISEVKLGTEFPLTVDGFISIYHDLLHKSREERLQIPGMIEMRVDMIVVASILVKYIIDKIGIQNIRVSAYALKEGILFSTIDSLEFDSNLA